MTNNNIFYILTSDLENLKYSGKLFKFSKRKYKATLSFVLYEIKIYAYSSK
jgi:hypothetical protein